MSDYRYKRANRIVGFTMVEVIVVLIIIAIAAAIMAPQLGTSRDQEALAAARVLTDDLRYAQDAAITRQEPVTVTFDTASESYSLSYASGTLIHPITKADYVMQYGTSREFNRMDLYSADFAGSQVVEFDETGAPDSAGAAELRCGDFRFQVHVSAFTGKVVVTRVGA